VCTWALCDVYCHVCSGDTEFSYLMRCVVFKVNVIRGSDHWLQLMASEGNVPSQAIGGREALGFFNKSFCCNEPEESPPRLTHRRKVDG